MRFRRVLMASMPLAFATSCKPLDSSGGTSLAAYSGPCNFDRLRICLQHDGGDVPCQKHRGTNNCSAEDVKKVKGDTSGSTEYGGTLPEPAVDSGSGYGWPTDSRSITSHFGPRARPCSGCSNFHYGIDIGIGAGTPVYASHAGNANGAWSSCGGNAMRVDGSGAATRYLHLSAFASNGKYVSKRTLVGRSGNTGSCTTGPHLHFEFYKGGAPVNPLNYIK